MPYFSFGEMSRIIKIFLLSTIQVEERVLTGLNIEFRFNEFLSIILGMMSSLSHYFLDLGIELEITK